MSRSLIILAGALAMALPVSAPVHAAELPAYLLQIPPTVSVVLIAETDTATLHRFSADRTAVGEHYMSIGQNGVDKVRPWDRRTPLGIYFVNEQLDTSRLHEKYGVLAYPIDYPNAWDTFRGKTGDGIWVHGVDPNGGRRPELDTDGCIALPNEDLLLLESDFQPLQTPVIVTRTITWVDAARLDLLRDELLAVLDQWSQSLEQGDWYQHLSLYAEGFSYRGLSRSEWGALVIAADAAEPASRVLLQDVFLAQDPEDADLYVSRFQLTVAKEAGEPLVVTKRLYWRRDDNGNLRIVLEDNA